MHHRPFRDLPAAVRTLAERHPEVNLDADDFDRKDALALTTYPAGSMVAPLPTHRIVYIQNIGRKAGTDLEYFAAYELTTDGLTAVWPEDPHEGDLATMPAGMVYNQKSRDLPTFRFELDGGFYNKPHEIAMHLCRFWGEPVAYSLLNGYHPHLDTINAPKSA